MMRRIDLLPPVYLQRRRQRRDVALVVIAGFVVLLLLVGWWILLGFQVTRAKNDLAEAQQANIVLRGQISKLQRFVDLQNEVNAKKSALQTVMVGDVNWPSVLTEIAMVIPGEVWLTGLDASAGQTEGSTPAPTETAPIPISSLEPFGRITFQGNSLSMPGVAKWMIRNEGVDQFFAVYLGGANKSTSEAGQSIVDFNGTLELSDKAASGRFQNGLTP